MTPWEGHMLTEPQKERETQLLGETGDGNEWEGVGGRRGNEN